MTDLQPTNSRLVDLVDDYVSGQLDEGGIEELESLLTADSEALRYFVRYAGFHTDLHLEMRRNAGRRALSALAHFGGADFTGSSPDAGPEIMQPPWWALPRIWLAVAGILMLAGAALWMQGAFGQPSVHNDAGPAIAWLVNAQNCQWADGAADTGDMQAGTILRSGAWAGGNPLSVRRDGGDRGSGRAGIAHRPARPPAARQIDRKGSSRGVRLRSAFATGKGDRSRDGVRHSRRRVGRHRRRYIRRQGRSARQRDGERSNDRGVSMTRNQSARIAEGKITLQTAKSEEMDNSSGPSCLRR